MLRLVDARTGAFAEVPPGRSVLLRVRADLPGNDTEPDVAGLRVLLIADLLARTAELGGLQVLTAVVFPGEPPATDTYAERAAGLLGIHPPAVRAGPGEAEAALGRRPDVHIAGPDNGLDDDQALVVRAGAVRLTGARDAAAADATLAGDDPLALRFALMSFPYYQAADLDESVMARACDTTRGWRLRVAEWAESPSRPIPERVDSAMQAAFGDLDTARALDLLRGLADDSGAPAGSKFETFAFADRILALDLAREVGRLPR
jgi:hypothetical protein